MHRPTWPAVTSHWQVERKKERAMANKIKHKCVFRPQKSQLKCIISIETIVNVAKIVMIRHFKKYPRYIWSDLRLSSFLDCYCFHDDPCKQVRQASSPSPSPKHLLSLLYLYLCFWGFFELHNKWYRVEDKIRCVPEARNPCFTSGGVRLLRQLGKTMHKNNNNITTTRTSKSKET